MCIHLPHSKSDFSNVSFSDIPNSKVVWFLQNQAVPSLHAESGRNPWPFREVISANHFYSYLQITLIFTLNRNNFLAWLTTPAWNLQRAATAFHPVDASLQALFTPWTHLISANANAVAAFSDSASGCTPCLLVWRLLS